MLSSPRTFRTNNYDQTTQRFFFKGDPSNLLNQCLGKELLFKENEKMLMHIFLI